MDKILFLNETDRNASYKTEYGKTSNPDMLATKFRGGSTGGPSEEVARLVGARFVNISEPEKKITFNAALVKRMTGNDTINARFLNENSFDFVPVFKIFINTNYQPNYHQIVHDVFTRIGAEKLGFDMREMLRIGILVDKQSPDIALGVDKGGAGDQGIMYGYVRDSYDLTPQGIIKRLGLLDVDYNKVSAYGHFGKPGLPWEE